VPIPPAEPNPLTNWRQIFAPHHQQLAADLPARQV
jgi:hypothetical protein